MPALPTRRGVLRGAVAAGAGSLAGCVGGAGGPFGGTTEPEPGSPTDPMGRLRFVHAAVDTGQLDVYVDDHAIQNGLPYAAPSYYWAYEAGEHPLVLTPMDDDGTELHARTVRVGDGVDHTIVFVADPPGIDSFVTVDDTSDPPRGNARFTVVNPLPAGRIDVSVDGRTAITRVTARGTGTTTLDTGMRSLTVFIEEPDDHFEREYGFPVEADTVYTAFLFAADARDLAAGAPRFLFAAVTADGWDIEPRTPTPSPTPPRTATTLTGTPT